MTAVEPLPGEPAAVADFGGERALVVADVHCGIETALRYERGVELASNADSRRERLLSLLDRSRADRLVVLGDLGHRIGDPRGDEREELETLVDAVTARVPLTLAKGNHDGGVAAAFGDRVEVTPGDGARFGDVGVLHGHTWPSEAVLSAETVCVGHEHPAVKLTDSVGGSRVEQAWLRGSLDSAAFAEGLGVDVSELEWNDPELVVFPAFNDRSGGTWVNVEGQGFLAPFLPEALVDGEAYLLDGTRLGDYRRV
ncbi:putative phosphoesterase [Halogranum amylolyticum]|uniref:Putative phosphoesterase n=1 Tax=Halogranum amylolyticum TaxID=660520 RepID=A0A1H8SP36_9EURY|nr:metallophosphoesterase [Halogranum amylolyticum]SEO80540.1 putative phosphoesterase [Halogranum amylolyticum]